MSAARTPVKPLTRIPLLFCVVAFSGCMVGGRFTRPAVPAAAVSRINWSADSSALPEWFTLFHDSTLLKLIYTALDSNRNLLAAGARIDQARAELSATKTGMLPQLRYQSEGGGGRAGINAQKANGGYNLGVMNVYAGASWEPDLWGKFRRANKSARAAFEASKDNRNALQVSLIAEVAEQYFLLRDLDSRLDISRRTLDVRVKYGKLTEQKFRHGVSPELDNLMAIQQQADVAASIPFLQRQIKQTENSLCLLLGQAPHEVDRGLKNIEQPGMGSIPAGLCSQLLCRRPDIRSAERSLEISFERAGIARANLYPSFSLTGLLGFASPELHSLFSGSGFVANGFGQLTGPLFHFNELRYQAEAAGQVTKQSYYQYQQTVLNAMSEVDYSLTSIALYEEEYAERVIQVDACNRAMTLTSARYNFGYTSFLEVLVQQNQLLDAEFQASIALQGKLSATIELYKSLGGGW